MEFNKENILKNVLCKVVNKENNKHFLMSIPYVDYMDLIVIYYIASNEKPFDTVNFIITNDVCKKLFIDKEELDISARNNTKAAGFEVHSIETMLWWMDISESESLMWVLSNKNYLNGASVLLFPDYFDSLAKKLDCDLYILPSSIHEVIAIPVGGKEIDELKDMVQDINSTEVVGEDFLSDNIYMWKRWEKILVML